MVWLRPTPDADFRALTTALSAAFPNYPPYHGEFTDPQPHLTIGKVDSDAARRTLRAQLDQAIAPQLPVSTVATTLSLLERDVEGQWHHTRHFPFLG